MSTRNLLYLASVVILVFAGCMFQELPNQPGSSKTMGLMLASGACCVDSTCTILTPEECTIAGGSYRGDSTSCSPNPCLDPPPPPPVIESACCLTDGTCQLMTADACATAGGTYQGDGIACDPNPCPQPPPPVVEGACCASDGTCQFVTADACAASGGTYQGDGIACDPNPCPQPPPPVVEGACCASDGTCQFVTADACAASGGTYQGDGIACDPNPCPQPPPPVVEGACCASDGTCQFVTADECATSGGTYQGDGIACDPNPCPLPPPPPPEEYQGCGLGYWKNHETSWEPTGHTPADLLSSLFTIPADLGISPEDTFMDALRYGGGSGTTGAARLLLREAVVAVLNATHPDLHFPMTQDEIVTLVNQALASGDRGTMMDAKNSIGMRNAEGCPLH
jgi:hypothetical protein